MEIRKYMEKDIPAMVYIWNKVCLLYTSPSPRDTR